MTVIKKKAEVNYTPAEMYELVNDIEKYPEFLPGCQTTTILSRDLDEVRAKIHLAKGGMQHAFSTVNRLQHNKMIEVRLLEGPFKHLEGFWRFDEKENGGCILSFDMEFIFSNMILDMTVGPILKNIADSFLEAFCKRAEELYGKRAVG
jgi:ribosome-associated toxin RatA of RatAB toxin-antitoxin module